MKRKLLIGIFFLTLMQPLILRSTEHETTTEQEAMFDDELFWENGDGFLNEIAYKDKDFKHEIHEITMIDQARVALHAVSLGLHYCLITFPYEQGTLCWQKIKELLALEKQKEQEDEEE